MSVAVIFGRLIDGNNRKISRYWHPSGTLTKGCNDRMNGGRNPERSEGQDKTLELRRYYDANWIHEMLEPNISAKSYTIANGWIR